MSAVGQRPTETYHDLGSITVAINRMLLPQIRATTKKINDSSVRARLNYSLNKRPLQDQLIAHFTRLKENNMAEHYQESRRILEAEYGTSISHIPGANFSYTPVAPAPQAANYNNNYRAAHSHADFVAQQRQREMMLPQAARQRPSANPPQSYHNYYGASQMASASMHASNSFLPSVRPHFKSSPFLEVKDWVGPAMICPEAPSNQQRSSTSLKMQLTPGNLEMLRRPTGIHQLRLFCTTKTYFDAAVNPNHPAPVEFPLTCEVKVNNNTLSVNLKGKKSAAKVLAPHLNKDHAMYFGGQDNTIELVYTGTAQKYVLSVAICEIRHADTLARRIKRDKIRSKADVLGAMKKAANDDDIEMGDVSMGLKCPLGAMRMTAPVRSAVCVHMQCFDALSFLSMNEQTPSWQCPICDKTINPDTLFLDGYVLDILEKVPDDEDTVLVDSEGKWHTPNMKFSSEAGEQTTTPPRIAAETPSVKKAGAGEGSNEDFPFASPPPELKAESQNKAAVEIFEIDDDDSPRPKEKSPRDQAQAEAQRQARLSAAKQSVERAKEAVTEARKEAVRERDTIASVPLARVSPPQPQLQRLPSTSVMMGNGNGNTNGVQRASSSREPSQSRGPSLGHFPADRPSGVALKNSPALPSPGMPLTGDAVAKARVEVIDLTLSDSEEEEMMPPPRRRLNSTVNGQGHTTTIASSVPSRPPSYPPAAAKANPNHSLPQRPSPSTVDMDSQGKPRSTSISNESARPNQRDRSSNGTISNGNNHDTSSHPRRSSVQSAVTQASRRRSNSHLNGQEDEVEQDDDDEDESQPVIRQRKRKRINGWANMSSDMSSEDGESSSASSNSENSEYLLEEERAGLAVRRG